MKSNKFDIKSKVVLFTLFAILFLVSCQKNLIETTNQEAVEVEEVKTCPDSCDDEDECTEDLCSEETNFECLNKIKEVCCGDGICEIDQGEDITSCNDDCKALGTLTLHRDKIDFLPKIVDNYKIIPYTLEEYNQYKKYVDDDDRTRTLKVLDGKTMYIMDEYIEETVDYYEWDKPPWEGGESTLVETLDEKKSITKAKYSKQNKEEELFTIRKTTFSDKTIYTKSVERWISGRKQSNTLRGGHGAVEEYVEPKLNTAILNYTYWSYPERMGTWQIGFLVFLPETKSIIEIDFGYSNVKHEDAIKILNDYIAWLANKNTGFYIGEKNDI